MGSIMIQCPRTLRDVPVGIDTDKHSFEAMPAVHSTMLCPACGAKHVWSKNWAWLDPMTVVDEEVIEAQLPLDDDSSSSRSSSASGTP